MRRAPPPVLIAALACAACGSSGGRTIDSRQTDSGSPQPAFPIYAAFYYPWYPETWTVNGQHVFYHPTLGYYSTTESAVEETHIRALDYARMNVAISSWWGQGHYSDTRLHTLMDTSLALGSPLRWSVYYEQEGSSDPTAEQIAADLVHIRDTLATSDAFLRVDGRFVVFVYNANDSTCAVADRWHDANQMAGGSAYVNLKVFSGYKTCANQPDGWHQYGPGSATSEQAGYSFTVAAGFWKADEASARLDRDPARWATDVASLVASSDPWKLVTTFNEWGEGTAIESADEWSSASGYGVYLDALHDAIP